MHHDAATAAHTTEVGATWSGTHVFRSRLLYTPRSAAELADVISAHDRVRVVGTRHSFNDIADGEVMVSLADIPADFTLDEAARTVTCSGGVRYGVLAAWLHERGFALKNMGSLPHISVGGATSTGTHGSGDGNGILSTAVSAVELLHASGETRTYARGDDAFPGVVPSLGALGVATRLTIDVEPAYEVRQDQYLGLAWHVALTDLYAVMASGYSVSLFTRWDEPTVDRLLVKRRTDLHTAPDELFGAQRADTSALPIPEHDNRTRHGVAGPWLERLPHFRLDATPSAGDEIQSEYFVDRAHGAAALSALRELGPRLAPHLIASEIRSMAADDAWLSPAHGRPSLGLHFTWLNHPEAVAELVPLVERALAPFDARPHWGKVFTTSADVIDALYPRIDDFRALRDRLDPSGTFTNDYLRRVGIAR